MEAKEFQEFVESLVLKEKLVFPDLQELMAQREEEEDLEEQEDDDHLVT